MSRIHMLTAELNHLCQFSDATDFASKAETLVKQVDEIGYRILSLHSISDEELLLLPTNNEEQVHALVSMAEKMNDADLSADEIYAIRAEMRQLQRKLITQYCNDPEQPTFRILPHSWRLLVYKEKASHPMNQYAEMFRVNGLPKLRTKYVNLLMDYQIHKEQTNPRTEAVEYLFEKRGNELLKLHSKLLMLCMQNRRKGKPEIYVIDQLQTLNTMLIQAAELNNPQYFRDTVFWYMYDRLKDWVNR